MRRETLLQVALVLVSISFGIQMAATWPILSRAATLVPFVLTHAGVAMLLGAVLWRTHRRQPVLPAEAYVLAVLVGTSWTADLGVLLMTGAR
jgi:hypothetical protein